MAHIRSFDHGMYAVAVHAAVSSSWMWYSLLGCIMIDRLLEIHPSHVSTTAALKGDPSGLQLCKGPLVSIRWYLGYLEG